MQDFYFKMENSFCHSVHFLHFQHHIKNYCATIKSHDREKTVCAAFCLIIYLCNMGMYLSLYQLRILSYVHIHWIIALTWTRSIQTYGNSPWRSIKMGLFICLSSIWSILSRGPWRVSSNVAWGEKLKLGSEEDPRSPGSHFGCDL